jgi:hypothetical protein
VFYLSSYLPSVLSLYYVIYCVLICFHVNTGRNYSKLIKELHRSHVITGRHEQGTRKCPGPQDSIVKPSNGPHPGPMNKIMLLYLWYPFPISRLNREEQRVSSVQTYALPHPGSLCTVVSHHLVTPPYWIKPQSPRASMQSVYPNCLPHSLRCSSALLIGHCFLFLMLGLRLAKLVLCNIGHTPSLSAVVIFKTES